LKTLIQKGDVVLFDHMGLQYRGVVLGIKKATINRKDHTIVTVKSTTHKLSLDINLTLFPSRVKVLSYDS